MKDQSQGIAYEVAHAIRGRIRLRIPELKSNSVYASQLQQLIAIYAGKLDCQIHTRINAVANSIIITYDPKVLAEGAIRQYLHEAIQHAQAIDPATIPFPENAKHSTAIAPTPKSEDTAYNSGRNTQGVHSYLTQRTLAKRLQISVTTLRQQRSQSDFPAWSRSQDPEGKAWRYEAKSGCFQAIVLDADVLVE